MGRLAPTPRAIALLILALGAVAASFAWQGRAGFNIGDEGYLWYGVQRVMLGEVPLRDFLSYDPGRYYWSAFLMSIWGGDGILSLRAAVALFQAAGLFLALAMLAREARARGPLWWILAAATLLAWMYPRHKLFDITVSIALVAAIAHLVSHPGRAGCFAAGVVVGLCAVFGRNHGVYGIVGSMIAIAYLALLRGARVQPAAAFASWACGVIVGYAPVLAMLTFIPGFIPAFWQSIRILFEAGSTNLPLPLPWPWRAHSIGDALTGLFFVGVVAFGTAGLAWAFVRGARGRPLAPLVVASMAMSLPYTHFAYSRADVGHLAQSVFPLLIGLLALSAPMRRAGALALACALCAASLFLLAPLQPGWRCAMPGQCVAADVGADRLLVERGAADDLALLRTLVDRYAPAGRTFFVAPFWPGAYAAFHRKSPDWEIYPLFPRGEALQRAELDRLRAANPGFVVILDYALDGREELRFANSHPIIDRYIRDHFAPVEGLTRNPMYRVYRDAAPAR